VRSGCQAGAVDKICRQGDSVPRTGPERIVSRIDRRRTRLLATRRGIDARGRRPRSPMRRRVSRTAIPPNSWRAWRHRIDRRPMGPRSPGRAVGAGRPARLAPAGKRQPVDRRKRNAQDPIAARMLLLGRQAASPAGDHGHGWPRDGRRGDPVRSRVELGVDGRTSVSRWGTDVPSITRPSRAPR
jgi:hypothetical protein